MKKISVYLLMMGLISLVSCTEKDPDNNEPKPQEKVVTVEVTTGEATDLQENSAVLGGSYAIVEGETEVTGVGFFISSEPGVTEASKAIAAASVAESFSATASELEEGTTYYFKAYANYKNAKDEAVVALGAEKQFTTPSLYVKFKDETFEAFCLSEYDMDEDGKLSYEEAEAVTGHVNFANRGYTDMTGIRAFKNVAEIELWSNAFTYLDLSGMSNLKMVWIQMI